MFEEDSVASADGHFAVAFGIPSEAETRSRIEEMSTEATGIGVRPDINGRECRARDEWESASRSSALYDPVQRIAGAGSRIKTSVCLEARRIPRHPRAGVEVEGLLVSLAISAEQAQAQTKIKCQVIVDAPIVLKIRLHDFVAVVILLLCTPLRVTRNIAYQQVGKRVPGSDCCIGSVKGEDTLNVGRIFLVLLREGGIDAELEDVLAHRFGHVVAIRVGWVGVVPGEVARVISPLTASVRRVRSQGDRGKLAAEAVIENRAHGEARGQA